MRFHFGRMSLVLACLATAGLALGAGSVLAQAGAQTCQHEGKTYQDGDNLTISGKAMECDGATGSWVPAQA